MKGTTASYQLNQSSYLGNLGTGCYVVVQCSETAIHKLHKVKEEAKGKKDELLMSQLTLCFNL